MSGTESEAGDAGPPQDEWEAQTRARRRAQLATIASEVAAPDDVEGVTLAEDFDAVIDATATLSLAFSNDAYGSQSFIGAVTEYERSNVIVDYALDRETSRVRLEVDPDAVEADDEPDVAFDELTDDAESSRDEDAASAADDRADPDRRPLGERVADYIEETYDVGDEFVANEVATALGAHVPSVGRVLLSLSRADGQPGLKETRDTTPTVWRVVDTAPEPPTDQERIAAALEGYIREYLQDHAVLIKTSTELGERVSQRDDAPDDVTGNQVAPAIKALGDEFDVEMDKPVNKDAAEYTITPAGTPIINARGDDGALPGTVTEACLSEVLALYDTLADVAHDLDVSEERALAILECRDLTDAVNVDGAAVKEGDG